MDENSPVHVRVWELELCERYDTYAHTHVPCVLAGTFVGLFVRSSARMYACMHAVDECAWQLKAASLSKIARG